MKKVKINNKMLMNLLFIVLSIILVGSIIKLLIDNKKCFNREKFENMNNNILLLNTIIESIKTTYDTLDDSAKKNIDSKIEEINVILNKQKELQQIASQNAQNAQQQIPKNNEKNIQMGNK